MTPSFCICYSTSLLGPFGELLLILQNPIQVLLSLGSLPLFLGWVSDYRSWIRGCCVPSGLPRALRNKTNFSKKKKSWAQSCKSSRTKVNTFHSIAGKQNTASTLLSKPVFKSLLAWLKTIYQLDASHFKEFSSMTVDCWLIPFNHKLNKVLWPNNFQNKIIKISRVLFFSLVSFLIV